MTNHAASPESRPDMRPGRRRSAALLASALRGSLGLVVSPLTTSANEIADGGGGGGGQVDDPINCGKNEDAELVE